MSVDAKVAEHPVEAAAGLVPVTVPAEDPQPAPAVKHAPPGADPMDFLRSNRVHVKDGSLFVDAFLVLHPRELDPRNEAELRKKLALTYSLNSPNFFDTPSHTAITVHLGQLVPVSLATKRSHLLDEIKKFNEEVGGKPDHTLAKQADNEAHPFTAILRQVIDKPEIDPVGIEQLKNGIALTLLLRLKLTQNGYLKPLSEYTPFQQNPDQVLHQLGDKVGITPLEFRDTARLGGINAVGKKLGLSDADIADVKQITEAVAANDFSDQMLQHWMIGRNLNPTAPLAEKIASGMQARIDTNIRQFREAVKHQYDVPEGIKAEETRVASALELLDPVQRKLMYALGYEICYTPDKVADAIAFFPGIYGLHRKAADKLSDVRGTYRIYFSGGDGLEQSLRTLVHEAAHDLWPEKMGAEEVAKVDALASADAQRFAKLSQMLNKHGAEFNKLYEAYRAGDEGEKEAVLQSADALFAPYGAHASAIFPYIGSAQEYYAMVDYASDLLNVEGARYGRLGYESPQERFREVLSRFAEYKQVRYRNQPQLLQELAPGLNQVFEAHYLPHLKKLYEALPALEQQQAQASPSEAVRVEQPSLPQAADPADAQTPAQPQPQGPPQPQPAPPSAPLPNPPADIADAGPTGGPQAPTIQPPTIQPPVIQPPAPEPTPVQAPATPPPAEKLAITNSSVAASPRAISTASLVTTRTLPALAALNAMGLQPQV